MILVMVYGVWQSFPNQYYCATLNRYLKFLGEELLSQMPSSPTSTAEERDTTDDRTSNAEEEGDEQSYSESY